MAYEKILLSDIEKIDIINTKGMTATEVYSKYKPDYILNGALYDTDSKTNIVNMKDEGTKSGYLFSDKGIGVVGGNKLIWCDKTDDTTRDFIAGAPVLVVNWKKSVDFGNKYSSYIDGSHKRSVIGFNDTHLYLLASDYDNTVDGVANFCVEHGMRYACNLDGGGSCHLQKGNTVIKKSTRANVSWILVYLKDKPPVIDNSGINIKIDLIPKGYKRRPCTIINPTSITIHNTGLNGVPADNFRRSCLDKSQDKEVSFHYVVDEKEIVQLIPDNEVAWHAGNRNGNYSSISIEICERNGSEDKAIELIRHLMKKHNIKIDKVVTHKSWSGKQCPHLILPRWDKFIAKIQGNTTLKDDEVRVVLGDKESVGKLIDGVSYVPVRFVSENLGRQVVWDGKTKTVTIN